MLSANYIEETTTSIATSGAGAVTLTQITGKPRFSTVFGSTARVVRYTIEDTTNFYFECGIGSVASNVLTRTLPQITWDGTTYKDGAAAVSAINNWGGSPSSGVVRVRISPLVQSSAPAIHAIQSSISGEANWRDYPVSAHIFELVTSLATGSALTAAREYYHPFKCQIGGVLNGVQMEFVAGASGNMKWGLYDCGSTGLPVNKLVTFNNQTTTAGIKTDTTTSTWSTTTPVYLAPGWYYTACIFDSAVTLKKYGGASPGGWQNPLGRADASYGFAGCAYVDGNYTTGLPATASPSTLGGIGAGAFGHFRIGLRIVA